MTVLNNSAHQCVVVALTFVTVSLDNCAIFKNISLSHVQTIVNIFSIIHTFSKNTVQWQEVESLKDFILCKSAEFEFWQTDFKAGHVDMETSCWSCDDNCDGVHLTDYCIEVMAQVRLEGISTENILDRSSLSSVLISNEELVGSESSLEMESSQFAALLGCDGVFHGGGLDWRGELKG